MARPKNDGRGRLGGRAKGTPNKTTSSIREWLTKLVNKNKRQIQQDLDALDPKSRLEALAKFLPYIAPKQQAVAAAVDLNRLSDDQLDQVIEQIAANVMQDGN